MTIWPIYTMICAGICFMIAERIIPARPLPHVRDWWVRVVLINLMQMSVVIVGGYTWEEWLSSFHFFDLQTGYTFANAMIAYLIITFIFYWWHKWRHDVDIFWNLFHQIHHSPQRIETVTSFYKHPFEIFVNSVVITFVVYTLMGYSIQVACWVTVITGIAELMYHMNIRTPHWWGYIFQRPESHWVHHQKGKHYSNFSDFPLWDIIFGTFNNPKDDVLCGFEESRELQFTEMLTFKNVNNLKENVEKK